jgi:hypothetical protein
MSTAAEIGAELAEEINRQTRSMAIDLDQRIVLKTPVDTGRARANWLVGVNGPNRGSRTAVDQKGGSTITENTQEISKVKPGQDIWLSNNLPYIQVLEMGSSKQAPNGMVGQSLKETARAFRNR